MSAHLFNWCSIKEEIFLYPLPQILHKFKEYVSERMIVFNTSFIVYFASK